jgi:hypothetical protein
MSSAIKSRSRKRTRTTGALWVKVPASHMSKVREFAGSLGIPESFIREMVLDRAMDDCLVDDAEFYLDYVYPTRAAAAAVAANWWTDRYWYRITRCTIRTGMGIKLSSSFRRPGRTR